MTVSSDANTANTAAFAFHALVIALVLAIPGSAAAAAAAPVLSTHLPPASPALPDASLSVIRVFGALALVLGLFLGGVWLFKNWQRVTLHRGRAAQLQILEMKALGGKHALYVVGYQQQRLLLASSPGGVSLLSHLPEEDGVPGTVPAPAAPAVESASFVQALQQAVQAKVG